MHGRQAHPALGAMIYTVLLTCAFSTLPSERVGFTPACEECWLENIACSFRACKFTCIKYKLFRQSNNKGGDELNDCLKCDERSCGPGFIECSGANRRRMGVISDIGREAQDQCTKVNVDWIHLPFLDESHN